MNISGPYFRSFAVGAVWFAVVAIKLVSQHPGHWSTYPPRNFIVLVVGWIITALLLGVAATRFEKLRSWLSVALGTLAGSILVLGAMLFVVQQTYGPSSPPEFGSTDEMMAYFATEATKWVKRDKGVDLDYLLTRFESLRRNWPESPRR